MTAARGDRTSSREPLVSVVIPAWNAEQTLLETLQSVAAQSYRRLEILIVDDGSTDRTASMAERFCAAEPRARLLRKPNGGVASARNLGIAEAQGNWIAPVDADDLWHPSKIEKQVAAAIAAPDPPGFVYCWFRHIDELGRVTGSGPRWGLEGPAFAQLAYLNFVQNGSALLMSRSAWSAVGGYDEGLRAEGAEGCEDVLLQLQIARRRPIAAVPEHLVGYRRHAGRMSSAFDQLVRSWRLAYERLAGEHAPVPPQVLRWISARCHFDIAEQRAAAGAYAQALASLAKSLGLDPLRSGLTLLYRSARLLVRAIRGRRTAPPPPRFTDIDPAAVLASDPDELTSFAALLRRIDEARLRELQSTLTDMSDARSARSRRD